MPFGKDKWTKSEVEIQEEIERKVRWLLLLKIAMELFMFSLIVNEEEENENNLN